MPCMRTLLKTPNGGVGSDVIGGGGIREEGEMKDRGRRGFLCFQDLVD
uniref:Uncharacterized protein n=1 Tax=Nelumbo nucifera TaxID=4432 RepID=A0A822ZBJ2_NELNU|nr:TPA_asm: hypothetical protein HUJ06_016236 [Nelumbo nucifera]